MADRPRRRPPVPQRHAHRVGLGAAPEPLRHRPAARQAIACNRREAPAISFVAFAIGLEPVAARWRTPSPPPGRGGPGPWAVAKVAPLGRATIGDADVGEQDPAGLRGAETPLRQVRRVLRLRMIRPAGADQLEPEIVPAVRRPRNAAAPVQRTDIARRCPRSCQRLRHRSGRRWRRRTMARSFTSLATVILAARMPWSRSSAPRCFSRLLSPVPIFRLRTLPARSRGRRRLLPWRARRRPRGLSASRRAVPG